MAKLTQANLALLTKEYDMGFQPKRRTRFSDLPREIRDIIYKYTLADASREFWLLPRPVFSYKEIKFLWNRRGYKLPAILQGNDQLAYEAAPHYWGTGEFHLVIRHDDYEAVPRLLNRLNSIAFQAFSTNASVNIDLLMEKGTVYYTRLEQNGYLGHTSFCGELMGVLHHWRFVPQKARAYQAYLGTWFEAELLSEIDEQFVLRNRHQLQPMSDDILACAACINRTIGHEKCRRKGMAVGYAPPRPVDKDR
jgi:hypothetical protein